MRVRDRKPQSVMRVWTGNHSRDEGIRKPQSVMSVYGPETTVSGEGTDRKPVSDECIRTGTTVTGEGTDRKSQSVMRVRTGNIVMRVWTGNVVMRVRTGNTVNEKSTYRK